MRRGRRWFRTMSGRSRTIGRFRRAERAVHRNGCQYRCQSTLSKVLRELENGRSTATEAERKISSILPELMFEEVRGGKNQEDDPVARFDGHRRERSSVPEVVFAEGKTTEHLTRIFAALDAKGLRGRDAMATRMTATAFENLVAASEAKTAEKFRYYKEAGVCCLAAKKGEEERRNDNEASKTSESGGRVAIVSAGTSDAAVAEEAAVCTSLLLPDTEVERINDVGVAGIHRVLSQLPRLERADLVICVAGMDGALPSVLGGLVRCPVVAVPTSVGYGAALGGLAPLFTMLNSCAPGVAVVNVDNGFGAAAFAAKFLGR